MAIEQLPPIAWPWRVSVYVPNEVEGQILGATQTHATATDQAYYTLDTYARRQGLPWLVRQENLIFYPRTDGTTGSLSPDCLVALDVALPDDEQYHMVSVGKPPALVIEIISKKTAHKDSSTKLQVYAQLGIQEYVTFDPRPRKHLELRGYRLAGRGQYVPIALAPEGGLWLSTLGLRVTAEPRPSADRGPRLRFFTAAGERLLHIEEEAAARDRAEQAERTGRLARARIEQERDAALAELARLRALLADPTPGSDAVT